MSTRQAVRHIMAAVMVGCVACAGAVTYSLVTSQPTVHEVYLDPSDRAPAPPVKVETPAATTPTWKA
jgi:hypothetical protein